MFDFIIIGAGVIGSAISRELSKYDLKIALIEKEMDVALGASKANSGIIHGGYAGLHGTLKGQLCIKGNKMYDKLNEELNFGFKRIGGMLIGFNEQDRFQLEKQMANGLKVGQDDFVWLDKADVLEKEPHINPEVEFALYMPSIGVTSPYELTIALVENAVQNGVQLFMNQDVINITYDDGYSVHTSKEIFKSKYVINAAGIHADVINHFVDPRLTIHKRRGQYILFGKDQSHLVNHVIFQPPTDKGKGILVTQTYHGNFMIGPDAEDLMDDIKTATCVDRITEVIKGARRSIPLFELRRALTTFSGIRAISDTKDFFIEEVQPGFITVGGIDSPGLTSAPAIASYVVEMVSQKTPLKKNKSFNPYRPSYYNNNGGEIVCFCEQRKKSEIEKTFEGPIRILSTDAVKRRVRAGMGNCQGKRCGDTVKNMIASFYQMDLHEIPKRTESEQAERVDIQVIKGLKC